MLPSGNRAYRLDVSIAIGGVVLMTWVNLAVGIIGDADNPWNLVFYAVLLLGWVLALIARFKPAGMVRAPLTTAMLQGGVALIALAAGWYYALFMAAFLALLWLSSAQLFRKGAAA